MSNEGDRAAVFRTTKVRTKLKGDGSWLQRRSEPPQAEAQEEKPWLAEVRAGRLNGAPIETSPGPSPTKPTPPPAKPDAERAPAPGYLIRGIFTKLDDKPASSASTSNGHSGTTPLIKKPSETYKKIAAHTVRPASESQEGQLSQEELDKRTEAASSVLRKSAARQRSYVFSAAKKYESTEKAPETPQVSTSPSFVAKRVEIIDDDESAPAPAPASSPPPSPSTSPPAAVPVTSAAAAPPRKIVNAGAKTAVPAVPDDEPQEAAPEPEREEPTEGLKPGCTKVDTPLPELILMHVEVVEEEEEEGVPGQDDDTPLTPTLVPTTPAVPESVAAVSPVPESPAPASDVLAGKTDPEPAPEPKPEPEPEPEPESKPSPKPSSSVDTLAALSDTLISFDTSPTSPEDGEPDLAEDEGRSADGRATENSVEEEPAPALSNCEPITDDLLALGNGPEESAEPVPPSPGRWSQDLLGGLDGEADPQNTSSTLDLLANDVIVIDTGASSRGAPREEGRQTDETAKGTQSPTETVTTTTKTVIITDKSSADPFDPYPIGTTSPNSSSDLLQPLTDISINSAPATSTENTDPSPETKMNSDALKSLADNVIPIDTDTTSTRSSWTRTRETSTPQQTNTEESREPEPEGQAEDQQTLIMFERKSVENDSPWDRWTSPTVYTVTTASGDEEEEEEEEEEESPEETQTQTVTTITTIREAQSEPEPAMDRAEAEEDRRVQTPESEAKKGFVYVKEYVNATELSSYNAKETADSGSDYLTPSSTNYSHSSPTTYPSGPLSSTCTYCGERVGSDAKITIEHLNINCHPACFKCGVCGKPMGDLLYSMFLHGGKVHCEACYSKAFD